MAECISERLNRECIELLDKIIAGDEGMIEEYKYKQSLLFTSTSILEKKLRTRG